MFDINILVRENVRNLVPYSCARDEFQGKEGVFLDANENPYGNLNRYPDPYQKELKAAISALKKIPSENIFLGNGSDEIIDLCFRIFCKPGSDKAMTFSPTYGMYEVSAAVNDVNLLKIALKKDFQIDIEKVSPYLSDQSIKLIFICSPNNPTGNSIKESDIEYIIKKFKGMVVIDEAYNDFSDKPSFSSLVFKYPNLLVMQTFSKAFGLAAARIGIAITGPTVVTYFNKMKPPYNISTINQKAALKKIKQAGLLKTHIRKIKKERTRLAGELKKFNIIEKVYPSDANFLLVKTKNADQTYAKLVENQIIVRNRNKIIQDFIRITIGTKTENNRLLKTLRKIDQ